MYRFEAMRLIEHPAGWASAAFLLALAGFGAKAGIVPLHIWLPRRPRRAFAGYRPHVGCHAEDGDLRRLRVTLDLIGFP